METLLLPKFSEKGRNLMRVDLATVQVFTSHVQWFNGTASAQGFTQGPESEASSADFVVTQVPTIYDQLLGGTGVAKDLAERLQNVRHCCTFLK